jgi:hypothetical protein
MGTSLSQLSSSELRRNPMDTTHTVLRQFNEMLERGIIPIIEHELCDDEYLVVSITADNEGLYFTLSEDLETSFSGDIECRGDAYHLPYDPYFDDLDAYLQMISDEITEGT